MTQEQAIELSKNYSENSEIIVVTSDNAIYLLNEMNEIDVIQKHADLNNLELFVVKSKGAKKEIKTVEPESNDEVESTENKTKKTKK